MIGRVHWNNTFDAPNSPALHDNDIYDPEESILFRVVGSSFGVDPILATANYWGSALTIEMQDAAPDANISGIYDFYDDPSLPKVDWSGFRTEPVPEAGPDW